MKNSYPAAPPVALIVFVLSLFIQPGRAETEESRQPGIKIGLASIFVKDQAAALAFYTDVLGFVKKEDEPWANTAG